MADYVKLPEVAHRLGVSEKTARRMVKAGKLPAVFVGNAYRVSEQDLAVYLEGAKVEPGKAGASPLQDTLFNGVSEQERRALEAIDDYCDRLEYIVKKPDLDPTIATIHGYIIKLVGDVAFPLWENETIRPALRPVFARYAKLARQLVEMVERWGDEGAIASEAVEEVEETSNVIDAAERFARAS